MASAHCAAELRKQGAEGAILLVTREPEPPYERPPLSKEYMRGEAERSDAYVHEPSWYEENDVELLTGTNVLGLDLDARTAKVHRQGEVEFGKALVGTGARVNILHQLDGAQLDGIHYLRAFKNADEIAEEAEDAERVVLVGGSYIACEVAASLTAKGKSCACVMLEDVALSRTFGEEAGRYFHDVLESHGVELYRGRGGGGVPRRRAGQRFAHEGRARGRGRVGRRRRGRAPGDDAGRAGGARGGERNRLRLPPRELGGGGVRGGRRLLLRFGDPRPAAADRALGRRLPAGPLRGPGDARRVRAVPGGARTSSRDLADWASLEYVGPATEWDEVLFRGDPAIRASSSPGTSRTARSPPASPSTAPRTWPTLGGCSLRAPT